MDSRQGREGRLVIHVQRGSAVVAVLAATPATTAATATGGPVATSGPVTTTTTTAATLRAFEASVDLKVDLLLLFSTGLGGGSLSLQESSD